MPSQASTPIDVEVADTIPAGWQHWLKWMEICMEEGYRSSQEEIDILRVDGGRALGFTRVVGRKR